MSTIQSFENSIINELKAIDVELINNITTDDIEQSDNQINQAWEKTIWAACGV